MNEFLLKLAAFGALTFWAAKTHTFDGLTHFMAVNKSVLDESIRAGTHQAPTSGLIPESPSAVGSAPGTVPAQNSEAALTTPQSAPQK